MCTLALDPWAERARRGLPLPASGYSPIMPVFIEGVPPAELTDGELFQELVQLYRTRYDTLRHGSDHALLHHTQRMTELEAAYLRRYPQREVDPHRTREGAQEVQPRT